MNKIWLLTRIQLLAFYGINRLRFGSEPKERRKAVLVAVSMLFLTGFFTFYSLNLVWNLNSMGLADLAPPVLFMLCSILSLFTFLRCNNLLFAFRDYDQVMSLPVSSSQVIFSRLLTVYLGNQPISLLIVLPGLILYGCLAARHWTFWPMLILSLPLITILPMTAAALLGTLFSVFSARFRQSGLVYTLLALAALIGGMALSFAANNQTPEQLASLSDAMLAKINGLYPLSDLFSQAMVQGQIPSFVGFAGISLLAAVAFVLILARFYPRLNSLLQGRKTRGRYKLRVLHRRGVFSALLGREGKRFLSSPTYILNSAIGPLMLLLLSAAAWLFGESAMARFLGMPSLVPLLMAFFLVSSVSTASSLSLEGKARWILYSLPLPARTVYNAKIAFSLLIQAPACLLSSLFLALTLRPDLRELLPLFLCPLSYALFSSLAGMRMNLAFPRYDWTTERQVVKRSMAVVSTMLIGFAVVFPPFIMVILHPEQAALITLGAAILILLGSGLLYANILKQPLRY